MCVFSCLAYAADTVGTNSIPACFDVSLLACFTLRRILRLSVRARLLALRCVKKREGNDVVKRATMR
jgi:hypothetical protein